MKYFLFIILLLTIYILVEAFKFWQKVESSKVIIANSMKYENLSQNYVNKILVLGDSTGFGVGVTNKHDSVSGLLANYTKATYVENLSVSGAQIKDLENQFKNRKLKDSLEDKYDIILIQIGGNDIMRFKDVNEQRKIYENFLMTLPPYKTLIAISAGDVGDTTLFPFFIRPFHSSLSKEYHKMFSEVLDQQKSINLNSYYINLSYIDKKTNPFLLYPEINLSPDGLHPSSAGYKLWFEKIISQISF